MDSTDIIITFENKPQAFEKLFRKYYAPLCDYCQGIIADKEAGEDIVQDVFVYLWNNRNTINITTSVKAYLYSSVRHGALHYLKKQIMQQNHSPHLTEFIAHLQETEYSEEEILKLEEAKKILQELPEQCRNIFIMNCIDGKKYKEIAEKLGISVNTVKSHLSKAYRIFRKRMETKDYHFFLFIASQIYKN